MLLDSIKQTEYFDVNRLYSITFRRNPVTNDLLATVYIDTFLRGLASSHHVNAQNVQKEADRKSYIEPGFQDEGSGLMLEKPTMLAVSLGQTPVMKPGKIDRHSFHPENASNRG
ncbi:hypothetical protein NPIL_586441 [Nephila pilipes]|uniref:Uncharacterized protein n=1 Tax=Nephila pilipes TaxID=299642 RepID=A0A8X6M7J8_NEPPI|nr:hypothetical protein NPIL_586441 [Nephila pilipes]